MTDENTTAQGNSSVEARARPAPTALKWADIPFPLEHRNMTAEEIDSFIGNHSWKFAKSMSDIPHAYVVREKCRSEVEFELFVMHIRNNGYRLKFGKTYYTYFDWRNPHKPDEIHQYWTMGAKLDITIIINRAIKGLNKR